MQSRFQPGTMIVGRFRLERPLGEGAYGEVWRAVQLPIERPVAIKLLKPSSDHFARQRFDREARAMAAINHPNCITFFDFGHLPGDAGSFLVSELVEGETLRSWMRQPRSLADKVLVCQQIVAALGAAHAQQVLHRDLKPENIMVSRDHQRGETVKVLDFGLSKIVDDERRDITKTGEIFGTPGYMSPEQLRGQEISAATDLYAFGVILFELLEGRPPYFGPTAYETCMMHLTAPVPAVTADVPPALAQLAVRLLGKDPGQRPRGPEISRILQDSTAGVSMAQTHAPPRAVPRTVAAPRAETVHERPAKEAELSRTPFLVGVGVLLILAVIAVISVSRIEPPPERDGPAPNIGGLTNRHQSEPPVVEPRPDSGAAPDLAAVVDLGVADAGANCGLARGITHRLSGPLGWALLRVPTKLDSSKPVPMLVLLHEAFVQDPTWFEKTALFEQGDQHGFLVLAPNDPKPPFQTPESWERVWGWIADARKQTCTEGPLFIFGYGAGGVAAESMPCHYDGITATATHSHRLQTDEVTCKPENPVPHLAIWPTKDGWDPVSGGTGCGKPKQPLEAHRQAILARQGCADTGKTRRYGKGNACKSHQCETPLEICEIEAGRPWPGLEISWDPCGGASTATKFPYNDVLFRFFTQQLED